MLTIKLKSYNHNLLDSYIKTLKQKNFKIKISSLPTKHKYFTLKKSPHVFGRSKERFTFSVHNKMLKLTPNRVQDLNQLLNFIKSNNLEGVGVRIQYTTK